MTDHVALGLALALAIGGAGCGGCDGGSGDPDAPVIDAAPSWDQCDGTPDAFVRQSFLGLLGRRPLGQAEVDVYVDLWEAAQAANQDPRAVVARAITRSPGFVDRWVDLVADGLAVQRIDIQSQSACWGYANRGTNVDPALALAVRDGAATGSADGRTFTMLDLARSAIALDDLTPILRGQVFAMVSLPIPAANVPPIEAELARRADFGATFDSAYLHRDIVCLGCHNSEGSVTDADDPALDRHWPVPGFAEKAVYGMSSGIDPDRAHAAFRVEDFVGGTTRPWGWDADCGGFSAVVGDDPAGIDGKLASVTGRRSTAFDLDVALRRGFEALRGQDPVASGGEIADPDAALAWLVSLAVVEDLYHEVVGTRLTVANYFPRNEPSAQMLQRLATTFTRSGYSLEAVLVDIVSSDYFNRQPAEAGCGLGPYEYPPVFDPWVISEADEARRKNGPGDAVVPLGARTLMSATDGALGWPASAALRFPDLGEPGCEELSCSEAQSYCNFGACCQTADIICAGARPPVTLHRGIGVYLRNSEHGFRGLDFQARLTWEQRYGACEPPPGASNDFIDELLAAGAADGSATVEDVVVALKDRVIGEPLVVDDAERSALAALLGGGLDRPASALAEPAARKLCGVLLATPQFLMQGIAGRGGARPKLTPPAAGYDAICGALAARDIGLDGYTITCSAEGLALAPGRLAPSTPKPRTQATIPSLRPSRGVAPARRAAPTRRGMR